MGHPSIRVYQDTDHCWRWSLIAGNGEIVAQGEAHTRQQDAARAARDAARLLDEAVDTESIEVAEWTATAGPGAD